MKKIIAANQRPADINIAAVGSSNALGSNVMNHIIEQSARPAQMMSSKFVLLILVSIVGGIIYSC